ncbi:MULTISPECIES: transcription-repair coupling factor [unclassified Prochlorococcus]|uniref:transcription-repair coupling factor n=1 Tax=unclassified Prochlorococcus TaxID=2627481 RepID=UPI0005337715|nr:MULTISPECIES: transcription-repair coupling factor [unclassified Prochlorococcus]KGG15320.1 Transcription-repair coupling factor [Prochlorococcus sp. MIT 0602]KGG17598.1 Transcription-repair coupling factor [Prochlorococcus sp. MIT 0603]
MSLSSLVNKVTSSSLTDEIFERTFRKEKLIINSTSIQSKALISSSLALKANKSLVIIVPTLEEANRWFSILDIMGWSKLHLYPNSEITPFESIPIPSEIIWGQLAVLSSLIFSKDNDLLALICTERALHPHLPNPEILIENSILIKKSSIIDTDNLSNRLSVIGYERVNNTDNEGQWSRRGDIIDIFAVNTELPVRIELFGDTVEKIKEFDPITQRSLDEIETLTITPISIEHLHRNKLSNHSSKNNCSVLDFSLLDYINENSFVVLDQKLQCYSHSNDWINHLDLTYNEYLKSHNNNQSFTLDHLKNNTDVNKIYKKIEEFSSIETSSILDNIDTNNTLDLQSKVLSTYPNQFAKIAELISYYKTNNYSIWILSSQPSRAVALLEEHDCIVKFIPNSNDNNSIKRLLDQKTPIALKVNSNIELEGVNLALWKILIITDKEFFGQQLISSTAFIRRRRRSVSNTVNPVKLKPGDYIVHRNHGIGQFQNIEKFVINNESRDYLLVKYLDGTLRVAADQLSSLGRYRTTSSKSPRLNKLGGATWTKAKERAKKNINKVAIDLIKLYAERSNSKGFAYPADGPWQKELEEAFPYDPTPDQHKAVIEIKADMEKCAPMDRLVCGDVGFGKTEVAIRALFKAITAGKQVAILTPTTVLAQQHWRTLTDRFAAYPIKISLLNRFKSAKERREIKSNLKNGKIDAIVGTHLLLSKQIEFKDLGLLVVDEEQRFGVTQKEKIKLLKKNIDVLTLTATPIPRTLYMSLSGVREMSLITTPPPLRRAIKTHLVNKDDEIIRSAISQEISRGGQVFYVVPRINGITQVADLIVKMIPNIKLLIAHGQMDEGDLESAMIAFNAGDADLMLCTTIIESGLDIPKVNTILIEDAHTFGLSQLYQLRGRVGRSGIQAHAWLFYPREKELSDKAFARLKAIKDFSQLGSGYQLAMRDMEIRGVGNLIGYEQSGQMAAIGFDMYMEILHESIAEIQGQTIPIVEETKVDLPITAFIPSTWITDNEDKLEAYKKASECETAEKLLDIIASWIDKYGTLPKPVESLVLIIRLKIQTKQLGFSRVKFRKPNIIMETLMTQSTFNCLKRGLHSNLQSRLIFNKGSSFSEVTFRGLGLLPTGELIETLINWLSLMAQQIPLLEKETNDSIKNLIIK